MKKLFLAVAVLVALAFMAIPAYALLDTTNNNQHDNPVATATGGTGIGTGGSVSHSGNSDVDVNNRNTNSNKNSNENTNFTSSRSSSSSSARQAQGQLQAQGQVANGSVNVGGDSNKHVVGEALAMYSPTTTANNGQQASAVYSIFGGVNMQQTAEYQVCIEKINVITLMKTNGYLTAEQAQAEATDAFNQLKDNTQVKRILWVGPKTRGVHAGNLFGMLSMDSCNEYNTDNWLGTKSTVTAVSNSIASKLTLAKK